MSKSVEKRVCYFFIILCFVAVLFINQAEAQQVNCTIPDVNAIVLNYTFILEDSNSVVITNATCTLTVPGEIASVEMLNTTFTGKPDGTYLCSIHRNFTTGNYPTEYTCVTDFGSFTDNGSFTVTYFDYDTALVVAVVLISLIFLVVSIKSEDRIMAPLFFFLSVLLIIVNFFITAELSFDSRIEAIMRRLYAVMIVPYGGSVTLYILLGWFYPFLRKAFGKKKEDVDAEVN